MSEWNWIDRLGELQSHGQCFALCTICNTQGSTPREIGAKMIVFANATIEGTLGGGRLESEVTRNALECLSMQRSQKFCYPLGAKLGQCCGGTVEVLIECPHPPHNLYIFGAGHVGQAVCETMKDTGFKLHLVDERKEYLFSPRIADSVERHAQGWELFVDQADWNGQSTFAVVMTHRHDLDESIVEEILRRPAKYIGLIGSKTKWDRFRRRYQARNICDEDIARVKCPAGIAGLGRSPKAVAISIAAEILSIIHA